MKKILLLLLLFASTLMVGCSNQTKSKEKIMQDIKKEKTIQDIKSVKELGKYLNIKEKNEKDYKMIGALDGYGFMYKNNEFEAYEYLNEVGLNKAKNMFKDKKTEVIGKNIFVISYSKNNLTDLINEDK